ncbi:hypothetical protein SmJEL517_g03744 [Synchytrium microbalum]|uniref:DNA/RNA-binding protein Alba-like domain-containing protein n=1 Tax=Synchytrium microbalum TaxID=1806994 RepID=A0A507BX59_9FUNG|nr:uncharacterized protein SmJEL517_g03744 [Synchytrium microbalum]TPX33387.1 hypothetical protein SmJEL517_g03744 [Synchytrium microbalum]
MENYRQKEVGLDNDAPAGKSSTTTSIWTYPILSAITYTGPEDFVVTIQSKASQVSQQIAKALAQRPEVVVTAKGVAMNKAVTVVEMLKRTLNIIVVTEIDTCKATDVWESVSGDLDRMHVVRNTPRIRLRVTKAT